MSYDQRQTVIVFVDTVYDENLDTRLSLNHLDYFFMESETST